MKSITAEETTFELKVKQQEPCLVAPAEETKRGHYFLSNLDQNPAVLLQTLYSFRAEDKGNEEAAEVMKTALAKVLVPYYPLAGKLTLTPDGKFAVDCTGEGAVFVEADADCELEALGNLTIPDPTATQKLFYSVSGAKNILKMPLMVAQVRWKDFSAHGYQFPRWEFFKLSLFGRLRDSNVGGLRWVLPSTTAWWTASQWWSS